MKDYKVDKASLSASFCQEVYQVVREIPVGKVSTYGGIAALLGIPQCLSLIHILMQTSLNPLLSNIVRGDRLASSLTFGQFVKAIASFLAPYIAMWGFWYLQHGFLMNDSL